MSVIDLLLRRRFSSHTACLIVWIKEVYKLLYMYLTCKDSTNTDVKVINNDSKYEYHLDKVSL